MNETEEVKLSSIVLDYFERTVKEESNKIAFFDEERQVSYSELYRVSQAIGTCLARKITAQNPILVLVDKSIMVPAYFMAILYAGCFYVPVNVENPRFRIEAILETVDADMILTEKKYLDIISGLEFSGSVVVAEEAINTSVDEGLLQKTRTDIMETDPLYVIFTSGSTGAPKGVVTSQKAVIDYIHDFADIAQITKNDVMGNQSPFDYDGSIRDIYFTLFFGASTFVIPKTYFSLPIQLFQSLKKHNVTTLTWAVSALVLPVTMNAFEHCVPDSIDKVLFAGSAMPCRHLAVWQRYLPSCTYINHYGPTEVTGTCTYYEVKEPASEKDILPIGIPFHNVKIILLDKDENQVPFGEVGEIYVGGNGIAYGYYNNEEKTKECFVQNPLNPNYPELIYKTGDMAHCREDGQLIFHGREDFQIKHMGHRIELGEVENNVKQLEAVIECACLYSKEKQKLYLFFRGQTSKKEIAIYLRKRLPDHMIPRKIVQLDEIPMKLNGKVDLEKLKGMI